MQFDLSQIPFSRRGAYTAFSHLPAGDSRAEGLYLRSLHGPGLSARPWQEVFRLEFLEQGQPVVFREHAAPGLLRLVGTAGYVEICLPAANVIRIHSHQAGLRLTRSCGGYDYLVPYRQHGWQLTICGEYEARFMLSALTGRLAVDAPWNGVKNTQLILDMLPSNDTGSGEWLIEEFETIYQPCPQALSFSEAAAAVEQEFKDWLDRSLPVPDPYAAARELAAYLTWSCLVAPQGLLKRPAMFMSKDLMGSIWSWDNCFNALALASGQPSLAWDQLMCPVDHQDQSGVFPDLVNDRYISRSFCKPPVYGWTLRRWLRAGCPLTNQQLSEIYGPLCRNTEWWFAYRDDDGDGIPQYNHGNDSGWDNSTIFLPLPPVESPDLSAYLVIQMDVLAEIAARLNFPHESSAWKSRANTLLDKMIAHFWQVDGFVACQSGTHAACPTTSLLLYLPLILGNRLPAEIRSKLVAGLKSSNRFLTEFGLATESLGSPHYQPDGYWRGPIWAAPVLFLVDALRACGEHSLAHELSLRFCNLCASQGMAENYNALTGTPLRDHAFTWTASIFMLLANELLI
jgi:putative isomerase